MDMRRRISLNQDWQFTGPDGIEQTVNVPHTWNAVDGQDGGDDYWRGACLYRKSFSRPDLDPATEQVYLEFRGVNASAVVALNGHLAMTHDGGYSTFRKDITDLLADQNDLSVSVDNAPNDRVYPQKADFTFYGGIYRDVWLIILHKDHFDMDHCGGPGIRVTPAVEGSDAAVRVETFHRAENGRVLIRLKDAAGAVVAEGEGTDISLRIPDVHLWDGGRDPYLYSCEAELVVGGQITDQISTPFGVRTFEVDPEKGFLLNGRPYSLRGVCRHQDWKGIGNAITREHMDRDMALIREMGANAIRLAHYQHDQYFYSLCDRFGLIVWAEIPYISEHMPNGRGNTFSQMRELIAQNYNHPSIITWCLSNEITISTRDRKDMLDNHRMLNDLVHSMDPTLFLNDLWLDTFHRMYPKRPLGLSEYGCEGMPNLHSSHPRRGDHTEEYQCLYHEYLLRCIEKRPYLWGTFVWNMFDFAADARDQGGEPGMNHKGLVSFDRTIRKDAFYLYKAWWSDEPFVHICSRRYMERHERKTQVKVYSNQKVVALYANGVLAGRQTGAHVFTFQIPLKGEVHLEARTGDCRDEAVIRYVDKPNPTYRLQKGAGKGGNWV